MAAHPFTDGYIQSLTPKANRYEKFDSIWRGLAIRVATSGRKTFMLWKTHEGITYKQVLGDYPSMTVNGARMACASAFEEMLKGAPPAPTKKLTVAAVFDLYERERKLKETTLENVRLVKLSKDEARKGRYRIVETDEQGVFIVYVESGSIIIKG